MTKYVYKTDTPDNIHSMKKSDILTLLESEHSQRTYTLGDRSLTYAEMCKIVNQIAKWVNLDLCNEQFMFVLDQVDRILCEACAGSGKTTISQLRLVVEKLFNKIESQKIYVLAYNKHAVKDMVRRHKQICNTINSKGVEGLQVSSDARFRTFDAFCRGWAISFKDKIGFNHIVTEEEVDGEIKYRESDILYSEMELNEFVKNCFNTLVKDKIIDELPHDSSIESFKQLSIYMRERLMPYEEAEQCQAYYEIDLDIEDKADTLARLLKRYDKIRTLTKKLDHTDILYKLYETLRDHEDAREKLQNAVRVLLVDEFQDMTPLRSEIIKHILTPTTRFIAIGDGDQAIYGFRGSDSMNCINFKENFGEESRVVSMSINRRCDSNIVDLARNVIENNNLRNMKPLKGMHEGGNIHNEEFESQLEQTRFLMKKLKAMTSKEQHETCIAYRNKSTSYLLSLTLLEEGIPFRIGSGYYPMTDKLSLVLGEILRLLENPMSLALWERTLWLVTPLTKAQVTILVDKNDRKYNDATPELKWKSRNNRGYKSLSQIDISAFDNVRGLAQAISTITLAAEAYERDAPLSEYMPEMIQLLKTYYWDYQKKQRDYPQELEEHILAMHTKNVTAYELLKEIGDMQNTLSTWQRGNVGVYLTTFHGLKGLEFNNQFVLDLEDEIFPGENLTQKIYNYSEETMELIREENLRLFYVVLTRARHNLTLCWNATNPSRYIDLVLDAVKSKRDVPMLDLNNLAPTPTPTDIHQNRVLNVLKRKV